MPSVSSTVPVPRRVLLHGGRVHSPVLSTASAMLTVDGRVAWIGTEDTMSTHQDSADQVVDLGGRLVTPGFVDAHAHLGPTGFALQSLDLGPATSMAAALDALAGFAASHRGDVLFAFGWDESTWPEARPFSTAELDRAVGDKVAYVARVDSHSAVVSSALLRRDGSIRDRDGWRPDGLVARDAHHAARGVTQELWTAGDREAALTAALLSAAGRGITQVHELNAPHIAPFEDFATVRAIAARSPVPEIVAYWGAFVGGDVTEPDAAGIQGFAGDLCVDGAVGSRTASMHTPYADAETSGHLYLDSDQITEHVLYCTGRNLQAGFHVIGDRAMAETVEGFQAAADKVGVAPMVSARHRLEHAEMPTPEAIATMARLGVVASVQPSFDAAWGGTGQLYERRLGLDRAQPMNPYASMHRAGVTLAFGSDSPVTPFDPWAGVRAAAFHHDVEERLTVHAAFDAHTRGGHRARRDDEGGVLVPGALATYAVWDDDSRSRGLPDLQPGSRLPTCVQTVVSGVPIFAAAGALDERALSVRHEMGRAR